MESWDRFLHLQDGHLGKEVTDKWLRTLTVVHFDAGNLYLEASDPLQILWFEEHIRPKVRTYLVNNNHRPIKVHLSCPQENGRPARKKRFEKLSHPQPISFQEDPLDPLATFENYFFHERVRIPAKLLEETAQSYEGKTPTSTPLPFNPLFLHGVEGAGKSHLLMSFAHRFKLSGKKTFYVSAERFTQHVVHAIRTGCMDELRKTYRTVDALIMDDVHILAKRNATQEELFHTFNALFAKGKLMLFSSDVPPQMLSEIEERLISRFEWGICLSLEKIPPQELPTFLRMRAAQLEFPLSEELIVWMAAHIPLNPTTLQKALQLLMLRVGARTDAPPLIVVQKILEPFLIEEKKLALNPTKIIKAVAEHCGIKTEDILGKAQTKECAFARQTAMWVCRKELNLSLNDIGKVFRRDHTTVLSSLKQIQKRLDLKDPEMTAALAEVPRLYGKIDKE
jgi:chromosomal replication initiator protein